MATSLNSRVQRLRTRKTDLVKGLKIRNDSLKKSEQLFDSPQDALSYIEESMDPVDNEYTKLTFEECDRVQSQLEAAYKANGLKITFRHQGSVTTDTHIKFYSDVDLLVLTDKFYCVQKPLEPTSPYKGNAIDDLQEQRNIAVERLTTSFPKAKVDTSGSKAVTISGGSLLRSIDIISASWVDTERYKASGVEKDRGISLLDLNGPTRISNFPFIHNDEINKKDVLTSGDLKKLIRFIKSVRYDSDNKISVSSYDIAALCYNLPLEDFKKSSGNPYELAHSFTVFSNKILADEGFRNSLEVPNKTRTIFGEKNVQVDQFKFLHNEVVTILEQAQKARRW